MAEQLLRGRPLLVPKRSMSARWGLGVVAIAGMYLSAPLGAGPGLAALGLVVLALCVGVLRHPKSLTSGAMVVCMLICLWWAVLLANPNVVSLEAGLLGYRKSVVFVLGIALGIAWVGSAATAARTVWYLTLLLSAASVMVFWFFPDIEAQISRSAGEYTSLFQGERRLQGLFAGPFHAALAGVFLALTSLRLRGIVRFAVVRWIGFACGITILLLSQVRTGFVALALGFALIVLTSPKISRTTRVLLLLVLALFFALLTLPSAEDVSRVLPPAVASLWNASSDSRFLGRENSWSAGVEMLTSSPLFGWGPGSAGATLSGSFPPGGHVTAHNIFVNYAVEGGLPGIVMFVLLLVIVAVAITRANDPTRMAAASLIALMVFGVTNATVDSLPISFGMAIVIGVTVRSALKRPLREGRGPDTPAISSNP